MASFKKLDNGKWLVKFYCKDHKGNNKQIKRQGFNTKKESIDFMNDYLALHLGTDTITLKTLITEFLKYRNNIKLNTRIKYNKNIRHIFRYFNEDILLSDIKEKQVLDFLLTFKDRPTAQRELKQFIGSIFDYGITYYNLKNNPINKIKLDTVKEKKEKEIYTLEEFKELDAVLKKDIYKLKTRTYFNLLYFSGARPGEISALTLQDIDYNNNTININKTRISLKVVNSPKNKNSYRVISIPTDTMLLLKSYTDKLPNNIENFYLFSNPTVYNGLLDNIIKKNNLKHITLHGFRHSHASLLIKKGVPITDIARRLGHANPQITLQVYSHFYSDSKDNIIDLLNNL